jgi:adenosylhomocysteine nucleosidase
MNERAPTGQRSGKPGARGVAPPPIPADVGIVAALPIEVGNLIDGLKKVWKYHALNVPVIEGEHRGRIVAVAVGGAGRAAARRAADLLISGHHPRWIVSAGFAGGINPALARNQLVLAHEVLDFEGSREPIAVPPEVAEHVSHKSGRLLTLDQPVLRSAQKAELAKDHQADLVDMETSAVATLCREKGVRFLSVRVISDDAHSDLPPEVGALLARSGGYQFGAVMRALWNRPGSIRDFWQLYERAIEAADSLAQGVRRCVDNLPS